jgi:hypothetical protein
LPGSLVIATTIELKHFVVCCRRLALATTVDLGISASCVGFGIQKYKNSEPTKLDEFRYF